MLRPILLYGILAWLTAADYHWKEISGRLPAHIGQGHQWRDWYSTLRNVLLRTAAQSWRRTASSDHLINRRLTKLDPDSAQPKLTTRRTREVLSDMCPQQTRSVGKTPNLSPLSLRLLWNSYVHSYFGGKLHPTKLNDNGAKRREPGPSTWMELHVELPVNFLG